jgi:phage baseplate assembly protein W
MPAQRASKGFKDISLSFQFNPLTNDLIAITNETAIARSVRNIVQTYIGEKLFISQYGSKLPRFIFDNMDDIDAEVMSIEIQRTLEQYEPRVTLRGVNVYPNFDNNQLDVNINYLITGISNTEKELTFALQPSRR